MTVISGQGGSVASDDVLVAEVTRWTFSRRSNNPQHHGSGDGGFATSVPGVRRGSGTIEGKVDDDNWVLDQLEEGSEVSLTLNRFGTTGWVFPAIIDSIDFDVDIDDGAPTSFAASFSTQGDYTGSD